MKAIALLLSDGETHRVMYLNDTVETVDGNKVIKSILTHKTIAAPTRETAEAALKAIKGLPFASTGVAPVKGSVVVVGTWGADPVLPTGKSK